MDDVLTELKDLFPFREAVPAEHPPEGIAMYTIAVVQLGYAVLGLMAFGAQLGIPDEVKYHLVGSRFIKQYEQAVEMLLRAQGQIQAGKLVDK